MSQRVRPQTLALLAVVAVGAGPARAQDVEPAEETPERGGLLASAALGVGNVSASSESHGTLNYQLQFGGFVSNSVAILLDLSGGRHSDDDFYLRHRSLGVGAEYWLTESFRGSAFVGSANLETGIGDIVLGEYRGGGLILGAGWVFWERARYHVDLRFQLSFQGYRDARDNTASSSLQVGLLYF